MNKGLLLKTFRNMTGVVVYVFLVSQIMQNGNKWFGQKDNMFTPFAVLLLFSLSAAVVGGLTFGQPVISFIDGKKKEGVLAIVYSIIWLAIYTVIGFLLVASLK